MTITQRNNVRISGKGTQPIMFAHGFGCDQQMWRYVTPAFEENYRVIVFDYVGAGNSDNASYNPQKYETLNGYVRDVLDICADLQLQDVIFVGHSVSAMIGMLAAIETPDYFARLIMIGPSACYIDDEGYTGGFKKEDIDGLLETMEKNYIGWSNFLAPQIIANPDRPELGAELTTSFCSTDPVIAHQFAKATFLSDNRKDILNLTTPTLILQCSEDIIAPTVVGQYIHSKLPSSIYIQMNATGHCPHMSYPEETILLMQNYLAGYN